MSSSYYFVALSCKIFLFLKPLVTEKGICTLTVELIWKFLLDKFGSDKWFKHMNCMGYIVKVYLQAVC